MKLLYATGACSLSVHILLEEIGLPYEAQCVSIHKKGPELLEFNPLGYVPVLILDSGKVVTEAVAILQYLAEKYPQGGFLPDEQTNLRVECLEWLTFTSSELHKGLSPLFQKDKLPAEYVKQTNDKIDARLKKMDRSLGDHKFLVGTNVTIADYYALAILRISEHVGVKLERYSAIFRYKQMLEKLPSVQKVLAVENKAAGLQKSA